MDDIPDDIPDFTPSTMIEEAVGKGLAFLRQHHRGHLILWAALESETCIGRESQHWPAFWHRLQRDFRRETGIVVWSRRGVGIKLLTIEEQLGWRSKKRMKKAARQHHKDMLELMAIPDGEMSDRQRQERSLRFQQARDRRLSIIHRSAVADVLGQPTPTTLPRPPRV